MDYHSRNITAKQQNTFLEEAWIDVLHAVDCTYADLVSYQERLEEKNNELEKMRQMLTSILSSMSDILFVINREGIIEQFSHSALSLTNGLTPHAIGQPISHFFNENDTALLKNAFNKVRETRRALTLEVSLLTQHTAEPLDLSICPRLDERSRVSGFVLTGRPMGELRKAYAELQKGHDKLISTQAQLVHNEKLASLGRLLAGVAHELNNPISFVYANAYALERYAEKFEIYFARVQEGASRDELINLREELNLDREVSNLRTAIDGARDGAERVRDIIQDLKRLSSDKVGNKNLFNLAEVARIAASWVLKGSTKTVQLNIEGEETLMAYGRAGHIQQIIMNLIQNAVDALENTGNDQITLKTEDKGAFAALYVIDNGPGVAPDNRTAIFDPFFTTKPVGHGTGLGLSISHKIAREHQGRLTLCPQADNAPKGSCFCLEIPISPPNTKEST